ncbi:hypothetical protein [Phytoactinopolyspora mesophila]|uniref:Uncharacterized protein n=1 Tax=Phytoactinopolyspora mesophila TaxID=2650750 RepID=A0A7K3MBN2_9ACTN|nr:hypothetical protein [Phytoactinopolyspora mesophila]NDL60735.1 hypothetical protein [Phytoactinopolyspora mesophila]
MSRWLRSAALAGTVPMLFAGCGFFGGEGVEIELIAGGGGDPDGATAESIRLEGHATDLAVSDGVVHLLADDGPDTERRLVTVEPDGSVSTMALGDVQAMHVAAGPTGDVVVATRRVIYRVGDSDLEPLVATEEAGQTEADVVAAGSIHGVAVDGEDRLIWTETVLAGGPDGDTLPLTRVMRLEAGAVEHVAGADDFEVSESELAELQVSPPEDVEAVDLPLLEMGVNGAVAAAEDGTVYLGGPRSVLRIDVTGGVSTLLGRGERDLPDGAFDDEREAMDFGGAWFGASIDAGGVAVVAVDNSLADEPVDVRPFDWSGDLGEAAQLVADKIVRQPSGADRTFNLNDDRTVYGGVAVVVREGRAATAMAHVEKVALEDTTLYAVGQTRERPQGEARDAEMLIVRMELPDD